VCVCVCVRARACVRVDVNSLWQKSSTKTPLRVVSMQLASQFRYSCRLLSCICPCMALHCLSLVMAVCAIDLLNKDAVCLPYLQKDMG